MNKNVAALFFAACVGLPAIAQKKTGSDKKKENEVVSLPDVPDPGPKPYKDVITAKAQTTIGLFTVHKLDDKVFFEIPDSLLGRDMLLVSRLAKAGTDMRSSGSSIGFAGDHINHSVVRFERGGKNKIFLREISYSERSGDSTKPMYRSLMNSGIQPIALALEVAALHKDSVSYSKSTVIDVTDLINSDNEAFFFGRYGKMSFKFGGYQADRSYLIDVNTYPQNTTVRTVKTFLRSGGDGPMSGMIGPKPVTVEISTSLVLLPAKPMQMRFEDERVGYFAGSYVDFDANPQGIKDISYAVRWRLEPKEEDIARYKRGELVEPKQPIIIYIDPATPAKWVPYLLKGIDDWRVAFEQAGFRNAISGRRAPAPAEDPNWSIDDVRYTTLVYKPSAEPNAQGTFIDDPRSGEIMQAQISWYHNVMKLIHDWYFIQTAAVDPRARKMEFDDELMGSLIRFVSSHEVGHVLGLRHNYGASSATPVEKLRDKEWVEKHGHTSSIMDYARFNYVAQPEDNISERGLFPRIGDYDTWAIEWGYRWIPEANTPEAETPVLNKWVIEKSKDKRYWYGIENNSEDPRAQNEDLGDNAMKAGEYGIKNLKRIIPYLIEWTRSDNKGYDDLEDMYNQLTGQFSLYIAHVVKNVGGRYENHKTREQSGPVYEFVPAATQFEAMAFLNKQLFATPEWLLDPEILGFTGATAAGIISNQQNRVLNRLISTTTFNRLLNAEALSKKAFRATDMLDELRKGIWAELDTRQAVSIYRRNLQKTYVEKMIAMIRPPASAEPEMELEGRGRNARVVADNSRVTDLVSLLKTNLVSVRSGIRAALPAVKDRATRYHWQDISDRISSALSLK